MTLAPRQPTARLSPDYHEPMTASPTDPHPDADPETLIKQPRLWRDNGWTATVIKNEDDDGWAVAMTLDGQAEPALVGPWTMGRDKKNPKPLDVNAFNTLVKTAREVIRRHEQQQHADGAVVVNVGAVHAAFEPLEPVQHHLLADHADHVVDDLIVCACFHRRSDEFHITPNAGKITANGTLHNVNSTTLSGCTNAGHPVACAAGESWATPPSARRAKPRVRMKRSDSSGSKVCLSTSMASMRGRSSGPASVHSFGFFAASDARMISMSSSSVRSTQVKPWRSKLRPANATSGAASIRARAAAARPPPRARTS